MLPVAPQPLGAAPQTQTLNLSDALLDLDEFPAEFNDVLLSMGPLADDDLGDAGMPAQQSACMVRVRVLTCAVLGLQGIGDLMDAELMLLGMQHRPPNPTLFRHS